MMLTRCIAFGLTIESDFLLPGAMPAPHHERQDPDLYVRLGRVPSVEGAKRNGPYFLTADGVVFAKPSTASFFLDFSSRVLAIEPAPNADWEDVLGLFIATALPMALWQRNAFMAHAAVAVLSGHDRAIGFAGVSGSGKTRLLEMVVRDGGTSVAEDSACLRDNGRDVHASGLPARIYMRERGQPLLARRRDEDLPLARCRESAALAAIVVLDNGLQSSEPVRLAAIPALAALLRHRHRPRAADILGQNDGVLPRLAAIARKVPLYLWRGPAIDGSEDADSILRSLRELMHDCEGDSD